MTKKFVYVAGAIRAYNPDGSMNMWALTHNCMQAIAVGLQIWRNGHAAFIPHASAIFWQGAAPDEIWLEGDLEIIKRCDALVTLKNWVYSAGARGEVLFARQRHIPVFHDVEEFFRWADTPLEPKTEMSTNDLI